MEHADRAEKPALSSAEANQLFYSEHAFDYDETEYCAVDNEPRQALRALLERSLRRIDHSEPAILDAGGGTGNASMTLRGMGFEATLIDASPEMLERYREKASAAGFQPRAELADLEHFFGVDERKWDMIVFSSVLHHLEDPATTLAAAAERVRPGGMIVTIFDPMTVDRVGLILRKLDYACWIAIHSPRTLLRALLRRLPKPPRGGASGESGDLNVGDLAERHAMSGLDDGELRREVEARGLITVEHDRIFESRYRWNAAACRWLSRPTHFSFSFQLAGSGSLDHSPSSTIRADR